jgi:predicted permease
MDALISDIRYAVRSLYKSPSLAAVAIVILALGIGANSAMFGILDALLVRPPAGVRAPDRIVRVYWANTFRVMGPVTQPGGSYPAFTALRDNARTLAGAAAEWPRDISVGRGAEARRLHLALASHEYFPLLGIAPAKGRFFGPDDDRPGAAPVVVLSDELWRSAFGRDSAVLGRTLRIGSMIYSVIGVAPATFRGTRLEPMALWLPMAVAGPELVFPDALTNADNRWLTVLGRLAPAATREQAEAELSGIYRAVDQAADADSTAHVVLAPIQEARRPGLRRGVQVPILLAGMAVVVLLVAAANVANLLLARTLRRRREIAVRLAIGAGRARLVRQVVMEGVLLSLAGGGAALLVALWTAPLLRAFVLPHALASETPIDPRVFAFTAAVALLVGVATGLVPGLQSVRADVLTDLKASARDGGPRHLRVRTVLLAGQAALTLILLAGAGLFVRSLRNLVTVDLGTETRRLLVVETDLDAAGYAPVAADAAYRRMLEHVAALPGVAHAAISIGGPFGWSYSKGIRVPGLDSLPHLSSGGPYYNAVSSDFFAALGTRIQRGRAFTVADRAGAARVAVVGETMARLFWPGRDAVGQCIQPKDGTACYTVVGVAQDARRNGIIESPQLQWYVPLDQMPDAPSHRVLWVRAADDPTVLVAPVRRAVQALGVDFPYVAVNRVQALVDRDTQPSQLGATVFSLFGALALLLAAVGLYGVLAYEVGQRTREMGIRLALGARSADVMRLVMASGVRVTLAGLLVGVVASLLGGKLIASLLYDVRPADPLVLGTAAAVLLGTALLAGILPARRASHVDPMVALRHE